MNYTRVSGTSVRVGDLGIIAVDRHDGKLFRRYHWAARPVGREMVGGWCWTLDSAVDAAYAEAREWLFDQMWDDFGILPTAHIHENPIAFSIYSSARVELSREVVQMRDTLARKNKGEKR